MTDWLDGSGRETAGASFFGGKLAKANCDSDILPEENIPVFLFAIHQLHPDTLEPYAPYLSPERWHRASAFRREADRLRCVAAGLLGNFCLWKRCGDRPMGAGAEPVWQAHFGGQSRPVQPLPCGRLGGLWAGRLSARQWTLKKSNQWSGECTSCA